MFRIDKITKNFYQALSENSWLEIHSVFENLINVQSTKGIFTIQNELIGLTPLSAIVKGHQPFSKSIFKPGLKIDLSTINTYFLLENPDIVSVTLKRSHQMDTLSFVDIKVCEIIEKELEIYALTSNNTMGFSDLIVSYKEFNCFVDKEKQYANPLHIMIIQILNDFVRNYHVNHVANFNYFIRLIGLGNGLTPSGDDFLIGLLSLLHYYDFHVFEENLKQVIHSNGHKTTPLSQAFLREGIDDNFSELIINFFDIMDKKKTPSLKVIVENILDYGHSSGMDIMSGILFGLYFIQSNQ